MILGTIAGDVLLKSQDAALPFFVKVVSVNPVHVIVLLAKIDPSGKTNSIFQLKEEKMGSFRVGRIRNALT